MNEKAPDRTLSQIEALLIETGEMGLTLFRFPEGWRANIKTAAEGFICGQARPTLAEAISQVFGEEKPEPADDWEDLI